MKTLVRISIVSIVLSFSMIVNSFAVPYNFNQYTSVTEESDLLPPGVKQSKATESAVARGDFFIRADLTIKNNGDGTIGALAVALTRFPVDEAYITIYLDRWDEESERWRQVKYHEEEFYAEEGTEGLEMPTVDISFIDQPRGYYYRLRGSFSVVYKGNFEGFSPVTDGILLD